MAEWNASLGVTTGGSNSSSPSEAFCPLVAILGTSSEQFVKRALDGKGKTDELNDEEDSHEGLLCAVGLEPMAAEIVPKGVGGMCGG